MASLGVKVGLAVRQLDSEMARRAAEYPAALPVLHFAALTGWELPLRWAGGVLQRYSPAEFKELGPLARQLEVNRAHAEARLVESAAFGGQLDPDEREWLLQRALGIPPSDEDRKYLEIASCPELEPNYMTSNPERLAAGVAIIETMMGFGTAVGYAYLLMAGVRNAGDLAKFGLKLEELFESAVSFGPTYSKLETAKAGIRELGPEDRVRLLEGMKDRVWQARDGRVGRFLTLTQVIEGHLGGATPGIGDGVSLAAFDAALLCKVGFPVSVTCQKDAYHIQIAVSARGVAHWNPVERHSRSAAGFTRRLSALDLVADGYLGMAQGYAQTHLYNHGARTARWVLALRPESATAYETLGQCLLGLEQPNEAIDACRRALELNPKLTDVFMHLGNAYSLLSRWAEAIDCYKKAIARRAGYAEAFNNLGLALQRNGEVDRAQGAYSEAIRIRPDYSQAHYNLGTLYFESGALDQATASFQAAVSANPNFAQAFYNLGQAYYRGGKLKPALEAYQAATRIEPKHAGAWHNMGIVYRDMGEKELAAEAIEKAVALNPILLR